MSFLDLIWLLFLLSTLTPVMQQRLLERQRAWMLNKVQRQRGSRVITLIHRQETISFLGIPVARYIDINDSEEVLRAIHLPPDDVPIDLVLHTPGGLVLAPSQIAHALARHRAPVRVLVPHYAMSGGTLIAPAAREGIIDSHSVPGAVEPPPGAYTPPSALA